MMPDDQVAETGAFDVQKFDKALHNRSALSCGFPPIDRFLEDGLTAQIANGYVSVLVL